MDLRSVTAPLLLALTLSLGCGSTEEPDPSETETQFYEVVHERTAGPGEVAQSDVDTLIAGNTASAFRLHRKLRKDGENLIFSPFSVGRAFAGYHDGEREAAAFEAVFGFTTDTKIDHWLKLTEEVSDRSDSENPEDKRSNFTSNDVYWVDSAGGGSGDWNAFDAVHSLPIRNDPEGARLQVNAWIEEKSYGMLPDFLPEGAFANAYAAATNVVFFRGLWPEDFTAKEIRFDGSRTVPGFQGHRYLRAGTKDGVTVLRLEYSDDYNHWILMPADDLDGFGASLDDVEYGELKAAATLQDVRFEVPEFKAKSSPGLHAAITAIRAETGTEGGTFTGAFMETILHQAAIEFTREGTKAAAATVIIEQENNGVVEEPPLEVIIDRPFLHVIEDARNGSILFMGEVAKP